jgi:wobble nucleotide-excising tRNase
LNYAFSIIKAALSDAGQLIVLTHNLQYMNETKKWLRKKTEKEVGKDKATATLLFWTRCRTLVVKRERLPSRFCRP